MESPFKIVFRKKLEKINRSEIIDLFITNISGTNYKEIKREGDNKLIIKGSYYEPLQNNLMTLWVGFCRKAELYFTKNNYVIYSVDFTYGALSLFIIPIMCLLPFFYPSLNNRIYYYFGLIMLILMVSHIAFRLFLHRQVFVKTLNHKNRFKGNYNWVEILKNKTDKELRNIIKGNTTLTEEIRKLAKIELEKRRNNN